MVSALVTQAPVVTLVHVAGRAGFAYTNWLGHPLVHVQLRVKACRHPQRHAAKLSADFWPEDEEAYKACNEAGASASALVLMIANSQGVENILCPTRTDCLERAREARHLRNVECRKSHTHDFERHGCAPICQVQAEILAAESFSRQ